MECLRSVAKIVAVMSGNTPAIEGRGKASYLIQRLLLQRYSQQKFSGNQEIQEVAGSTLDPDNKDNYLDSNHSRKYQPFKHSAMAGFVDRVINEHFNSGVQMTDPHDIAPFLMDVFDITSPTNPLLLTDTDSSILGVEMIADYLGIDMTLTDKRRRTRP